MQREQVPVRYRQNAQTAALLDTLGLTADELAVLVEDVKAQFFVDTATWALPLWEAQVGISAKPGTSDDARRAAIRTRLVASGNTNEEMVSDIATAMTGYAAEVQTNNDYSFTLRFRGATTKLVQRDRSSLTDAIEIIKPAHLRFIISGLTWHALESVGMMWQQIEDAEYTWDQFEDLTPAYGPDD